MAKQVVLSEEPISTKIFSPLDIAKRVKYERTKLGFTRKDAAGLCGVSYQTFCNIENGNKGVQVKNLLIVAHILGIVIEMSPIVKEEF